jgi:predicted polyphosphate/ATP-dependent NAD kinase
MTMHLGFIVNPIAGMGGRVGLKGTDNVAKEALAKGAEATSPTRATDFLKKTETKHHR